MTFLSSSVLSCYCVVLFQYKKYICQKIYYSYSGPVFIYITCYNQCQKTYCALDLYLRPFKKVTINTFFNIFCWNLLLCIVMFQFKSFICQKVYYSCPALICDNQCQKNALVNCFPPPLTFNIVTAETSMNLYPRD